MYYSTASCFREVPHLSESSFHILNGFGAPHFSSSVIASNFFLNLANSGVRKVF